MLRVRSTLFLGYHFFFAFVIIIMVDLDEHIFGPPAPPDPPPANVPWNDSIAREMLERDLATGVIPLSGHVMRSKAVYATRPEYAAYPLELFTRRLSTMHTAARTKSVLRANDAAGYGHDRLLFPKPTHDERGHLRWEGSVAEQLLKTDITNYMHKQILPRALYNTRAEYPSLHPDIFREHIHQEVKRRKFIASYYGR